MTTFELLTTADCHLCEHSRHVLDTLAAEGLLAWQDVNSDTPRGRILAAQAPPLRPALFDADGHLVAYGRLSEKRLRRQLHKADGRPVTAG